MEFYKAVELKLDELRETHAPSSFATNKHHGKALIQYWGKYTNILGLTRDSVQRWADYVSNPRRGSGRRLSSSSVHHELSFLRQVWKMLEDRGITSNIPYPMHRIKLPRLDKQKRNISAEVIELLRAELSEEDFQPIDFAIHTLLRRLEIWNLRVDDIDFNRFECSSDEPTYGALRVVLSKTGTTRLVPLNSVSARILRKCAEAAKRNSSPYLFPPYGSNRVSACTSWNRTVWVKAMRKIEAKGHFHGLRYFGAHTAWKNGAKIEAIAKMLGHSTTNQTIRYIGIDDQAIREVAQSLQNFSVPFSVRQESAARRLTPIWQFGYTFLIEASPCSS